MTTSRTFAVCVVERPRAVAWAVSARAAFATAVARVGLVSAWAVGESTAARTVAVVAAMPAVARREIRVCRVGFIRFSGLIGLLEHGRLVARGGWLRQWDEI